MGPQAAVDYCRRHPGIAAAVICPVEASLGWELQTIAMEHADLELVQLLNE
jgi:hypothetical protein